MVVFYDHDPRRTAGAPGGCLEVLAAAVPEDEEAINTTEVDEVGTERDITGDMNEVDFLRGA